MNIIQVYKQFPTQQDCIKHLEAVRWNGTPVCPYCQSIKQTPLKNTNRYHCNTCNTSFSVTVGTIFHKTKLDLQKWFLAISLVFNAKKGYSARGLGRDIEVTKDTAWRMFMQIRNSLIEQHDLMEGIIEADETYIGDKNKNRHSDNITKGGQGCGGEDKTPVIGLLQHDSKLRAKKSKDVSSKSLTSFIKSNVKEGSTISTVKWREYNKVSERFNHLIVAHCKGEYLHGQAHTNSLEGFWSLFKRVIVGQYHQISIKHLERYVDEFCFRYNNRKNTGMETFNLVINKSVNI